jgi:SAM-dependent methyltransferase
MDTVERTRTAAEIYDEQFVPALFQQWGPVIAGEARIGLGDRVLDVACGTGVLACACLDRVGTTGRVTGLDPNLDMLAVARRKSTSIDWWEGRAERIPFPDASFDAVVSQFGFMFFDDHTAALREMIRVLVPGGRLAVAVCDAVEHSPGYAALADLLQRLFGSRVADTFRTPFKLGGPDLLRSLFAAAGIPDAGDLSHRDSSLCIHWIHDRNRAGVRLDARGHARRLPVQTAPGEKRAGAEAVCDGRWEHRVRHACPPYHRQQSLSRLGLTGLAEAAATPANMTVKSYRTGEGWGRLSETQHILSGRQPIACCMVGQIFLARRRSGCGTGPLLS